MALEFGFTLNDLIKKETITEKNVNIIKQFLKDLDEKCVPKSLPDELIGTILVACFSDIDLTKKTIISYFKLKIMAPCLFDDRTSEDDDFLTATKTVCFAPVPWPEENIGLFYAKLRDTNYRNCFMEPAFKVAVMIIDTIHVEYPPDGLILVIDIQGFGLMHLTRIKFESLKVFLAYLQEGMPVNLKAVHFINSNYVLTKFLSLARIFIAPEQYRKIQIHQGSAELQNYIPKSHIPSEYDGELLSVEYYHKAAMKKIKDMQKFWDNEEALRKQCV